MNQIKSRHMSRKLGHRRHRQQNCDISPPSRKARVRADKESKGWWPVTGDNKEGKIRQRKDRRRQRDGGWSRQDQGSDDGASSVLRWMVGQSRRRQLVNHQSPTKMKAHGGDAGGRSHGGNLGRGSRGVSSCDDSGTDGDPDRAKQSQSLGDPEDLEGQDKAADSGDRDGVRDLEDHGGAGATEDECGARGKKESDRARGTKWRDEARGVESRGGGWSTTDQGGAGGIRDPSGEGGMKGHGEDNGARSLGRVWVSKDRGGVQDPVTGGRDRGTSRQVRADGRKPRCGPT